MGVQKLNCPIDGVFSLLPVEISYEDFTITRLQLPGIPSDFSEVLYGDVNLSDVYVPEIEEETIHVPVFFCESVPWDDSPLYRNNATQEEKDLCRVQMNRSGYGTENQPWKNIVYALEVIGCLGIKSFVLRVTGTVNYSCPVNFYATHAILTKWEKDVTSELTILVDDSLQTDMQRWGILNNFEMYDIEATWKISKYTGNYGYSSKIINRVNMFRSTFNYVLSSLHIESAPAGNCVYKSTINIQNKKELALWHIQNYLLESTIHVESAHGMSLVRSADNYPAYYWYAYKTVFDVDCDSLIYLKKSTDEYVEDQYLEYCYDTVQCTFQIKAKNNLSGRSDSGIENPYPVLKTGILVNAAITYAANRRKDVTERLLVIPQGVYDCTIGDEIYLQFYQTSATPRYGCNIVNSTIVSKSMDGVSGNYDMGIYRSKITTSYDSLTDAMAYSTDSMLKAQEIYGSEIRKTVKTHTEDASVYDDGRECHYYYNFSTCIGVSVEKNLEDSSVTQIFDVSDAYPKRAVDRYDIDASCTGVYLKNRTPSVKNVNITSQLLKPSYGYSGNDMYLVSYKTCDISAFGYYGTECLQGCSVFIDWKIPFQRKGTTTDCQYYYKLPY